MDFDSVAIGVAVVCFHSDDGFAFAILGVCPYPVLINMYSLEHLVIPLGSDGRGVMPRPVVLRPCQTDLGGNSAFGAGVNLVLWHAVLFH